MANDTEPKKSETLLVARVLVHLNTGEAIELLPFFDEADVKSKVMDLIGDWAKSGYLLKGNQIYPWHQVKLVEAASVVEISRNNSEEQIVGESAIEVSQQQQGFWKTKQPRKQPGESDAHENPATSGH